MTALPLPLKPRTTARRDTPPRPPQVLALVAMDLAAAALCLFGVLRPPSPDTPVVLDAIGAIVGLLLAGVLTAQGSHAPKALLTVNLVLYVTLTAAIVIEAGTGEGAASTSMSFLFVSLYVAAFLPRPALRLWTAGIVVIAAVALALSEPIGNAVTTWLPLACAIVVATELLAGLVEQLRVLGVTDSLTGVLNRKGFEQQALREQAVAARTGAPVALVVIDLNDFKSVNDRHGHAAGDALLGELTARWRDGLRGRDVIGRRGGDEFALLLPDTGEDRARELVERLRSNSPTAWSFGVSSLGPHDDLEQRLATADQEMYRQKRRPPDPVSADR